VPLVALGDHEPRVLAPDRWPMGVEGTEGAKGPVTRRAVGRPAGHGPGGVTPPAPGRLGRRGLGAPDG